MKKNQLIPALALTVLLLNSCKRDEAYWDTGITSPIAFTTLTIDNIVPDSLLVQNPDTSLKLMYTNDFFNLTADSLYKIPDTTLTNTYYYPFGTTNVTGGDYLTNNSVQQTTYNLSGIDLVYVLLRGGKMTLKLKNDVTLPILLTYEVPSAVKNGIPFDTTFLVPAAPDATHSASVDAEVDLSNYGIDMTGLLGDRVNTIVTRFTAQVDPSQSSSVPIGPADSVSCINTFKDMDPYYVRGYFGNNTISVGPEEQDFSFFKKITAGSLSLEELKMNLVLQNYIGMDARVYINSIYSKNSRTGNVVSLNAPIMGQALNFNRAVTTGGWLPVIPYNYSYTLDNTNSNAKQLVENLPDKLGYNIQVITNPLGNVSGSNDFFFIDYPLKAHLDIEMPLSFIASGLTLTDTLHPDFTGIKEPENVLSGTLTVHADNGMPFSAGLQLYLLDAYGQLTDSLVVAPGQVLSAPVVSVSTSPLNTWRAQGKTHSTVQIRLSETQTQALLASSKVVFRSVFDTHSGPLNTRIYSTDALDLKLTADFNYRVHL